MTRILLVEPHTLLREGLRLLLLNRDDTEIVGVADTAQNAFQSVETLCPDLCIIDTGLSGESLIETVSRLRELQPGLKQLMLLDANHETLVRLLLQTGANGIVCKSCAYEELDFAIGVVLSGYYFISPELMNDVVESYLSHSDTYENPTSRISKLSQQERRVLSMLCHEIPPKAIAQELGISRKTVDIHKKNIKRKLGVSSDIGLMKAAISAGVPIEDFDIKIKEDAASAKLELQVGTRIAQ
ncbi:MAG TPA: response regulator transcription factor [Spirochaetales bacterium]|nr:response regulator transcription factor [Spirochaetales bacterium]